MDSSIGLFVLDSTFTLNCKFLHNIQFFQFFFIEFILYSKFNSLPASGDFCCLLITFANSLDPDQDRQNVGPDPDPNHLTL